MYTLTMGRSRTSVPSSETEVALPGVRQDGDHRLGGGQPGRHLARRPRRRARRDPRQDTFLPAEPARPCHGILVAHGDDAIDDVTVEHARNEGGTDALDAVRP